MDHGSLEAGGQFEGGGQGRGSSGGSGGYGSRRSGGGGRGTRLISSSCLRLYRCLLAVSACQRSG